MVVTIRDHNHYESGGAHMASSETSTRSDSSTQQSGRSNQAAQAGQSQAGGNVDVNRQRQENRMARRGIVPFVSPFALLQRILTEDLSPFFGDTSSTVSRSDAASRQGAGDTTMTWVPKIDVFQRNNELVVRADLPGVRADDVAVEITDDSIVLSGRKEQERVEQDDSGAVYRIERTYGSFFREIPLPEGSIADQATATFKDGVLEIRVPSPPEQVSRGRRVQINQASNSNA
jgi:HSP20 family protein